MPGMWMRKGKLEAKAVKFLWKWKHFEERSWKRKQTRKRLTLNGAGSGSKKLFYCYHIPVVDAFNYSMLHIFCG